MSANALLFWMSARREGSWQQFRNAVEALHVGESNDLGGEDDDAPDQFALSLYQAMRFNLQRLGHAEFFAGAGDAEWRVTPPSLAVTHHARGWLGILVGARSPALLQRLHAAVASASANMETLALPEYPDQILLAADNKGAVAAVAERAGLVLQGDAPAALLASLPPVDDPCVRGPAQLPFGAGWRIDRFSSENLAWRSATFENAASSSGGLFRFSLRHQRHVLFCSKGAAFRIPGQVGKYLVLRIRRRQVLHYDGQKGTLSVPASCRPPFLIERALIMCSGSPASYEYGILHYPEVPENIAVIAVALLRQELR